MVLPAPAPPSPCSYILLSTTARSTYLTLPTPQTFSRLHASLRRPGTPSHAHAPQYSVSGPPSARKGDLRGSLSWRRQQSIFSTTRGNTRAASSVQPSPARKKGSLGFARIGRTPGAAVPVKQPDAEEVSSDFDDLGGLDVSVGDDDNEATSPDDKAAQEPVNAPPPRPRDCIKPAAHGEPSPLTEGASTNSTSIFPSPALRPDITIETLFATVTESSEAYIFTISLPDEADKSTSTTPLNQITSQLTITPIPNDWLYLPPSSKKRKANDSSGIPQTTLSLYCVPHILPALYKLGKLTDTDIFVIRGAARVFHELLTRKLGVEIAGGRGEWGYCAFGPKQAKVSGGVKMEVVMRRVGEDWLKED